jgi:hypothetical protein
MNDVDKTEIIKLNVWKNENHVKVYGIYNPPQNNPSLSLLGVSKQTLVVGDFNTHFHDVGYKNINEAGKRWKILSRQIMLNYFMKRKIPLLFSITMDPPKIQISRWLLILLHLLRETLLMMQDVDTG